MINAVAFVSVCCIINYILQPTLCLCFCQQSTKRLWCFLPPGETFVGTFQRYGKSPGISHETHFMTYPVRAAPIAPSYGLQSYFFHISFGVCPVMNAVYSRRGPINLLTPRYFFSTIFCGPNPSRTRCFRGICCRNRGHIFMRKQSKNSTHFHMLSPLGSSTWILGQLGHPARFHSTRNEKKIDIFIAFSGWNYKFIVTSCNRVQFLAWNLSPW